MSPLHFIMESTFVVHFFHYLTNRNNLSINCIIYNLMELQFHCIVISVTQQNHNFIPLYCRNGRWERVSVNIGEKETKDILVILH